MNKNRSNNKGYHLVWEAHNKLMRLAESNGFTTKNILGEYTEFLCSEILDLRLLSNNKEGFDALDNHQNKVQIKGRQIKSGNSAKLTTLWNLNFDYIIAVVFNKNGKIYFVQKIPVEAVIEKTKIDPKKNCRRYIANVNDSGKFGIEDITNLFIDY